MSAYEDQDLGEDENDEPADFPPPERKLVTQAYDLSIQVLLDQWDSDTLVIPEIQRGYVWDNGKASRLIESLLLNIPIPVLYFAETPESKWEIIDGQQRIVSIVRYLQNEFSLGSLKVMSDLTRKRFRQLPDREQRYLERRTMRAVVISPDSHPNMKFEVFSRLNTGSVALNNQEIRNAIYRGSYNRLLRELAKDPLFRVAIGTKNPRNRMVDEELILRFFALRESIRTYRPPLSRVLNEHMTAKQENLGESEREVFQATIARTVSVLGAAAFRVTDAEGIVVDRSVNRALFDAQMLAFSWTTDDVAPLADAIIERFAELYEDSDFQDAIRRATGDRARLVTRVKGTVAALRDVGVTLRAPRLS